VNAVQASAAVIALDRWRRAVAPVRRVGMLDFTVTEIHSQLLVTTPALV
jgi:hypothetical protein